MLNLAAEYSLMKAILFNIHDLALLTTLGICILFTGILTVRQNGGRLSRYLLICFFWLIALVALNTLTLWGDAIKYRLFDYFPYCSLLFSFASFAMGPVLYWYIKSQIDINFSLAMADYWHLIPAAATPVYLYLVCFRFPPEMQRELLLEFKIYNQPYVYFNEFIFLKKNLPVIYGMLSFLLIYRHRSKIAEDNSGEKYSGVQWLKMLAGGFSLVWLWILITHLVGLVNPGGISDLMGIFGNYLTLLLVAALTFFDQVYMTNGRVRSNDEIIDPSQIEQIRRVMEAEKPFLNPRLTLDRLAELVGLSPRQLSLAINRCFCQNYHEYVNGYRVENAKRMLVDREYLNCTILEIAQLSGFNSKATFNRVFKSFVSVTPTEYRKRHTNLHSPSHLGC